MKRILSFFYLAIGLTAIALAQPGPQPPQPPNLAATQVNVTVAAKPITTSDCFTRQYVTQANSGAVWTLTFPAANTVANYCWVIVTNGDVYTGPGTGRGRLIIANGGNALMLYPGMTATLTAIQGGTTWHIDAPNRWSAPNTNLIATPVVIYTDYTNGVPAIGAGALVAADGFAPGAGAYQSVNQAINWIDDYYDMKEDQTIVQFQMAPATIDSTIIHWSPHGTVGSGGGAAFIISGATLPVTAINNSGGNIAITVSSTSSYTTYSGTGLNTNTVYVYGVGSNCTAANGPWHVTVLNGTQLLLQGSNSSGCTTGTGTVTNGSQLSGPIGNSTIQLYYDAILELQNVILSSNQNALQVQEGAKAFIGNGVMFDAVGGSQIFLDLRGEVTVGTSATPAPYGITGFGAGAVAHIVATGDSLYRNTIGIMVAPGLGTGGYSDDFVLTNLNSVVQIPTPVTVGAGTTVTGQRWATSSGGQLTTVNGTPNVDIPGSSNGIFTDKAYTTAYPLSPTGTANTSGVMAGLGLTGGTITPIRGNVVTFSVSLIAANNTAGDGCIVQIRYGTGTAPSNGNTTFPGTSVGGTFTSTSVSANLEVPTTLAGLVAGLSPGVPVWYDLLEVTSTGGTTCSLSGVTMIALEQ